MVVLANDLNLYNAYPPSDFVSKTDHLISIVSKRTMLLKKIRDLVLESSERVLSMKEWHSEIEMKYFTNDTDDLVSHIILRLALSNSEDASKWFKEQEILLFYNKFSKASDAKRMAFLESCGSFEIIHQNQSTFYRVPFEHVPSLVAHRSVELEFGYAMVPKENIVEFAKELFSLELDKHLAISKNVYQFFQEDPRMLDVLKMFSNAHMESQASTETDFSSGLNVKVAGDIKNAKSLFPPCMANLQDQLDSKSHLKHGGRMQYGLFIKALGLPVQEALIFWRKAFKNITDDVFHKQYAYNIRHNYGLEGKKADYKAYNCSKIIMNSHPGTADNHGCPFKHFSKDSLKNALTGSNWGINKMGSFFDQKRTIEASQKVNEIVQLASDHHYQFACSKWMENVIYVQTGQQIPIPPIEHPNGYACTISSIVNENK